MASEIASLAVRVGADITPLTRDLNTASGKLDGFGAKVASGAGAFAKYAAAAAAAGAAVATALVAKSLASIDAQAKLAQQVGTTSASMATLARAGELSGIAVEKIAQAGRALTIRLGQAAAGAGPAAQAIKDLGLSADELQKLPLDERIATINARIREMVPASQQAAMAAKFFGNEAGVAIASLSPDTIAKARRQTELFGTAISDIDAAKIEQANDAFSTIAMAFDGLVTQMTIEVAPILKAIGDMFLSAAEDAGGMGNAVRSVFDGILTAAAWVMNAIDGIKRVLSVVLDSIIWFVAEGGKLMGQFALSITEALNNIPGVDMSDAIAAIQADMAEAEAIAQTAGNRIAASLTEPLAGDQFLTFVENARMAGEEAAKAAVEARQAVEPPADEKLAAQAEANAAEVAQAQQQSMMLIEIDRDRIKQQIELERQKEASKKQILGQAFGGLTTLMNSESRKMFEIGKAAAISQAIVSTYTGRAKALELGWPLGPIAAGAIALTGFQQVASIRAQSFGGGGAGGAGAVSNTAAVNAANTPVNAGQAGTSAPQTLVNVTLEGQMFGREQVIGLVDTIRQLQSEGSVVALA